MTSQNPRVPIFGIDLARFIAASFVVFYHLSAKPFLYPAASGAAVMVNPHNTIPAPSGAPWWGWIGVQVFFVISGVVIGMSAEGASPSRFFVGRVARLWPMILVAIVFIVPLNVLLWHETVRHEAIAVLHSLILFPIGPWVTGQMWTLPVEALFYAAIWLMLFLKWQDFLQLFSQILGFYSATFWIIITYFDLTPLSIAGIILVWHGIYFASGMVIIRIFRSGLLPIDALTLLFCVVGAWCEIAHTALREAPNTQPNIMIPFGIWLTITGFVLLATLYRSRVAAFVNRHGLAPLLRNLGLLTYPLYLLHLQVGALVMQVVLTWSNHIWLAAIVAYAITILVSLFFLKVVDRPLTGLVRSAAEAVATRFSRFAR